MAALFHPFRALGYITENVPFAIQRRGKETFVTVSVGKAWQIYNCSNLRLALVGPELPSDILALAAHGDLTFAAVKGDIFESNRVHRSGAYRGHKGNILQLLVLGDLLLSLGSDGRLTIWRIKDYDEPQSFIDLEESFQPSCMAHPDTYLNKIIIGSAAGQLQLWNFVSGKLLYTFNIASCAIRCLSASPALDVVGIGLSDGRAVLHNLKFDVEVVSFANASGVGAKSSLLLNPNASKSTGGGACTAISFRTGAGVPLMAAGGGSGAITVWNLEQRQLQTVIRDAHDGPLLSLHFFTGEPRLMSSASDNSVKQWVFDTSDGSGRLLRFRSGHSAPPAVLRHYGDGNRLLSAGQDRAFRMFSVIQDQQSRELSQGHIAKKAKRLKVEQSELKLPRVIHMDACQVRERDWANVITAHAGDSAAYTWRLQHFTLGDHILRPATKAERGKDLLPNAPVTSVAMSSCGNFGFVGTASGRIDRYNMQSGIHRGTYNREPLKGAHRNAHDGSVVGLACDACNHLLVSTGYDGWLRVWDFKKRHTMREIQAGSPLTTLSAHPGTQLVAVAADDLVLRMYDVETGKKVRTFAGHQDRITDLGISSDGRWLLSSSMDGTLRVWDIPAARTLQVMRLGAPVTSMSLAPGQELLATTHVNRKGIYLWSNQSIFGAVADMMPSEKPVTARLPSIAAEEEEANTEEEESGSESEEESSPGTRTAANAVPAGRGTEEAGTSRPSDGGQFHDRLTRSGAPMPLMPHMVTLSMLPRTQWQNLAYLDAIKERSRPVQPLQKPEAAPFFLPTVATLSKYPVFDTEAAAVSATATTDTSLPGWGTEDEEEAEFAALEDDRGATGKRKAGKNGKVKSRKKSRVMYNAVAAAEEPPFVRALRAGAEADDFSELILLLRDMSAIAVDQQLQAMQIVDLENAAQEQIADLDRVLLLVETEVIAGRSFEHIQALLRAFLRIHGETLSENPELREHVARLQEQLASSWNRLESKLQHVRCLVNFLGNLPV